ncbi:MAG: FHA protein, partial [uncultured bacterium]
PASYTWVVDTAAPIISLLSPANGANIADSTPLLNYTFSDGTVVVKVDDVVVTKTSGESLDILSEASHTVSIEATDSALNVTTVTNTFTVDITAPDTTISANPNDPSSSSLASFSFTSDAGTTFECKIDSTNYSACASPKSYTGLGQGNHLFTVRAIDSAGNVDASPASYAWNIDFVPTVSAGSPWGKLRDGTRQTNISVTTDENSTCKYSYNSGSDFSLMNLFSTTGTTSHSTVIGGLSDGKSYGLFVRCQDANGNINQSDYLISFRIDKDDSDDDKKKKTKPRSISNSKKSIARGATLTQRGKKFSKNNYVLLYFSRFQGGYYAPQKIKTSSTGAFTIKYVVSKPKGKYGWYAVDVKTGKKSKTITYKVK